MSDQEQINQEEVEQIQSSQQQDEHMEEEVVEQKQTPKRKYKPRSKKQADVVADASLSTASDSESPKKKPSSKRSRSKAPVSDEVVAKDQQCKALGTACPAVALSQLDQDKSGQHALVADIFHKIVSYYTAGGSPSAGALAGVMGSSGLQLPNAIGKEAMVSEEADVKSKTSKKRGKAAAAEEAKRAKEEEEAAKKAADEEERGRKGGKKKRRVTKRKEGEPPAEKKPKHDLIGYEEDGVTGRCVYFFDLPTKQWIESLYPDIEVVENVNGETGEVQEGTARVRNKGKDVLVPIDPKNPESEKHMVHKGGSSRVISLIQAKQIITAFGMEYPKGLAFLKGDWTPPIRTKKSKAKSAVALGDVANEQAAIEDSEQQELEQGEQEGEAAQE